MCGIVGYAKKKKGKVPISKIQDFMDYGLMIDSLRGVCGTGVAGITNEGKAAIFKKAIPGYDFVNTKQFENYKDGVKDFDFSIGHNRAQTIGKSSDENCHPFRAKFKDRDHIVLVHNGTINNHHSLSPKNFKADVDSNHVAAGMSAYGEAITLEEANGWFVFVWANLTKRTFNIAKHGSRDLYLATTPDGLELFYASEEKMLRFLLGRAGIETDPILWCPKDDEWITWNMDDETFKTPSTKNCRKPLPPIKSYSGNPYSTAGRDIVADDLEVFGVKRSDEVGMVVEGWVPWNKDELNLYTCYGYLVGHKFDDPKVKCKIIGITKNQWETQINNPDVLQYLLGFAQSVEKKGSHYNPVNEDILCLSLDKTSLEETLAALKKKAPVNLLTAGVAKSPEPPRDDFPDKGERQVDNPGRDLITVTVPGPNGDLISIGEWKILAQDGCCYCGSPVLCKNHTSIVWMGEVMQSPLCHECSDKVTKAKANKVPSLTALEA